MDTSNASGGGGRAKRNYNIRRDRTFDPKGIRVFGWTTYDALNPGLVSMNAMTLPHPPTVNDSYKLVLKGRRPSLILSPVAKQFKAIVAAGLHRMIPITGATVVRITSYGSRTDIDGCIKITLDSLQGFAYANDRMIRRLVVEKLPADGGSCPRLEVTVTPYVAAGGER